jgi:hypothetical protein
MNISALSCQIPSDVKKYCMLWHFGRGTHMHDLATNGVFNAEKLLVEVDRRLSGVTKDSHRDELNIIREYVENIIERAAAEAALYRAADKVMHSSNYTFNEAIEYFRLCFDEFRSSEYGGY